MPLHLLPITANKYEHINRLHSMPQEEEEELAEYQKWSL